MNQYTYTSCYCEENVYLLLAKKVNEKSDNLRQWYAIILTNPFQQTYIKYQKLSNNGLVVWDYHVIVIMKETIKKEDGHIQQDSYIYDFDSKLQWGCAFEQYFNMAINFKKPNDSLKTLFKVCDSKSFLANFSSDRSHMIQKGKFLKEPPKYPCIKGESAKKNHMLTEYLDTKNNEFGKWMDEEQFYNFFKSKHI